MIVAGIDMGTIAVKTVVFENHQIKSSGISVCGEEGEAGAFDALSTALDEVNLSLADITRIVATGTGKESATFAQKQKSLPACLAKGLNWLYPEAEAVIDIGALSTTVVKIGQQGRAIDFLSNDVCASGSGIFLETMAKAMRVPIEDMPALSEQAKNAPQISNTCVVFAESEVVSLVHKGVAKNDIIAGLHRSIADRIFGLTQKMRLGRNIVICGGVARNTAILKAFESRIGCSLIVPNEPQHVAALGAALFAEQQ
jgi:(R)-2-hydroxyacyl-CoA dehydratese activating ATPase